MMEGLFSRSELESVRPPLPRLPACGKCKLYLGCKSPKMEVSGGGRLKILVVGEAPGATEDADGVQFVGDVGRFLEATMEGFGVDLHEDCWLTNALACRPPNNKIPNDRMVDYCRPLVIRAIEELQPHVVLLLGKHAVRSVIGHFWNDRIDAVEKWAGFRIPLQSHNCWICPTWHPSHIMRQRDERADPVKERLFASHIKAAVTGYYRPWPQDPPDYESRLTPVVDPEYALAALEGFMERLGDRPIAFDYETTTLRPYGSHAEIVCCSVSDGRQSVAFPWHGNIIRLMKDILSDPGIPKSGWNIKMEDGWTRHKLGFPVRGWTRFADGMLNSHALDCRKGITGLKFQTFVRLGVPDYAHAIKPFLKSKGDRGNAPNRIWELVETAFPSLLKYCAYDSLFAAIICRQQTKEIGG